MIQIFIIMMSLGFSPLYFTEIGFSFEKEYIKGCTVSQDLYYAFYEKDSNKKNTIEKDCSNLFHTFAKGDWIKSGSSAPWYGCRDGLKQLNGILEGDVRLYHYCKELK